MATTKEKLKNPRSRVFNILLYPDNESHIKAKEIIEKSYDYAIILHNKDYDENGEVLKEHYHCVVRFKNPKWLQALSKDLNLEDRFIEETSNFKNSLLYLVHFNDSDKFQYDVEEVKGNLKNRLIEEIAKGNESEGEKIVNLLEYVEKIEGKIRYIDFAKYCAKNGYWSEYRRAGAIINKIIDEKNDEFIRRNVNKNNEC